MLKNVIVSLLSCLAPAACALASDAVIPLARTLPLDRSSTLAIGEVGRNDKQATLAWIGKRGFQLVFASGKGVDLDDMRLFSTRSDDAVEVGTTEALDLAEDALEASPAFVDVRDARYLYFVSAASYETSPREWRIPLEGQTLGVAQELPAIPGLTRLIGWPQWIEDGDRVVVSFRDRKGKPWWGASEDGIAWQPDSLGDVASAYVRVVPMTGGGSIFTYQHRPTKTNTLTFARFSRDGKDWSVPEPLASPPKPAWPEVHDAFALARKDRGVDVYYSYPSPKRRVAAGFDLYRRAVLGPGQFGPEQRLTDPESFDAIASSAHRLQDGAVLLTFSSVEADSDVGVTEARLHVAKLADDAPLPVAR